MAKTTLAPAKQGNKSKATAKVAAPTANSNQVEIEIPANMISGIEFYNQVEVNGKTITFKNGAQTCRGQEAQDLIAAMFEAIKQKRAENDKVRVRFVDSEYNYWLSKKEGSKFWNVWRKALDA